MLIRTVQHNNQLFCSRNAQGEVVSHQTIECLRTQDDPGNRHAASLCPASPCRRPRLRAENSVMVAIDPPANISSDFDPESPDVPRIRARWLGACRMNCSLRQGHPADVPGRMRWREGNRLISRSSGRRAPATALRHPDCSSSLRREGRRKLFAEIGGSRDRNTNDFGGVSAGVLDTVFI